MSASWLVGVESHAVEEGHLVERPGDRPFHAGAVVAPDVEDQRVVEVAEVVDRVEQPPDVPVRVLREPGEHLHLPRVASSARRSSCPDAGKSSGRSVSSVSWGTIPSFFWRSRVVLRAGVPALVELALVLVGPFPGHVVRGVAAAGRVVHHPRLRAASWARTACSHCTALSVRSSGK